MNAQQITQNNEEKNLIWIKRPYYYFTLPQIRMLVKKEAQIDSSRLIKWMDDYRKDPKLAGQYKPSRLFYIYEQMLTLSIPTKGRLRYTDKIRYTPYLLSNVLEGNFEDTEIDEVITLFANTLYLISIEQDGTIVMNLFNEFFDGFTEEITTSTNESTNDDNNDVERCINKLIEHNYITSDHKEKSLFEEFFSKVLPTFNDLSISEVLEVIAIFATSDVKKAKGSIKSPFKYFESAFRKAIEDLRAQKKQASFIESCETTKKDWF